MVQLQYSRNTNAEDGTITFNGLNYFEEGIHYYRIKEIDENDENIIYDKTEYIIKIEVEKNGEEYFIEDISLINNNKVIYQTAGNCIEIKKNGKKEKLQQEIQIN